MVLALTVIENVKNTGLGVFIEIPDVFTGMVGVFTEIIGVFTANLILKQYCYVKKYLKFIN